MKLSKPIYIILLAIALVVASCQEMPRRVDDGRIIASVDGRLLQLGELNSALPAGVSGEDSLHFANLYVDRWIARQIKVREAERIFSSSVQEVESMVAAYRHSLLTRKLDQYYIDSSTETPFTESDINSYYVSNMNSFKLDGAIVKGSIMSIPKGYSDTKRLVTLMKSKGEESRLDLISIVEKSGGCNFQEFTSAWMTYDDFIAMLPVVRGRESMHYLKVSGVQSLEDGNYSYYFEISGYRSAGYVAPLEIVRDDIVRILTKQHHKELIKSREERLYERAKAERIIQRYVDKENNTQVAEEGGTSPLFAPALIK